MVEAGGLSTKKRASRYAISDRPFSPQTINFHLDGPPSFPEDTTVRPWPNLMIDISDFHLV